MSVGMVGFMTNVVVVVVGVAVVEPRFMVACVGGVGRGASVWEVWKLRERELRDCESSEKKKKGKNIILIRLEE